MDAIFVETWPFWAGGIAIGGFVLVFLLATRNLLGVATGFSDLCGAPFDARLRRSWRLRFLLGIVLGGFVAAVLAGGFAPTLAMGDFDARVTSAPIPKVALFLLGGILLGFGSRLANGCTSGHGIVGMALLAPSSVRATVTFFVTGVIVTHLLAWSAGG